VASGELYINVTVSFGSMYEFWFNDTVQTHDLVAAIWDGTIWVSMIDEGAYYHAFVTADTDVLTIRITPGSDDTLIHYIWSDFAS
jgi:hypothetical protein